MMCSFLCDRAGILFKLLQNTEVLKVTCYYFLVDDVASNVIYIHLNRLIAFFQLDQYMNDTKCMELKIVFVQMTQI